MTIALFDPEELPTVDTHPQVALAAGSRLVLLAGEAAWAADGTPVGGGELTYDIAGWTANLLFRHADRRHSPLLARSPRGDRSDRRHRLMRATCVHGRRRDDDIVPGLGHGGERR